MIFSLDRGLILRNLSYVVVLLFPVKKLNGVIVSFGFREIGCFSETCYWCLKIFDLLDLFNLW